LWEYFGAKMLQENISGNLLAIFKSWGTWPFSLLRNWCKYKTLVKPHLHHAVVLLGGNVVAPHKLVQPYSNTSLQRNNSLASRYRLVPACQGIYSSLEVQYYPVPVHQGVLPQKSSGCSFLSKPVDAGPLPAYLAGFRLSWLNRDALNRPVKLFWILVRFLTYEKFYISLVEVKPG
jgi:hypothetical protein